MGPVLFTAVLQWAMGKYRLKGETLGVGIDLTHGLLISFGLRNANDVLLYGRARHEMALHLETSKDELAELAVACSSPSPGKTVLLTNEG